jgi:hypothetical protein
VSLCEAAERQTTTAQMVRKVDQMTVLALSIANFMNGHRLVKGALESQGQGEVGVLYLKCES